MAKSTLLTDIEILKKAIRYRGEHRGTKEADWLIGGFLRTHMADFCDDEIHHLKALIDLDDESIFKEVEAPKEPYINIVHAFRWYKNGL